MLKTFEDIEATSLKIETALETVSNHFNLDIINISFGIKNGTHHKIVTLCKQLMKHAVVASEDSEDYLTIPDVIGVISDDSVLNSNQYNYIESVPIQIDAYGKAQRVA